MKTVDDFLKEHNEEVSRYNLDPKKLSEHDKLLNRCKERSLYLIEHSLKTESRLRDKLKQSGRYGDDIIDETIEFLKQYGYVDDLKFAELLIKQYSGIKSMREIEQKLYQRGVDQNCIKEAMAGFREDEELSHDSEMRAVRAAIRKKCKDVSALDTDSKRKLYVSLIRKGYSYSIITSALSIDEDFG